MLAGTGHLFYGEGRGFLASQAELVASARGSFAGLSVRIWGVLGSPLLTQLGAGTSLYACHVVQPRDVHVNRSNPLRNEQTIAGRLIQLAYVIKKFAARISKQPRRMTWPRGCNSPNNTQP